MLFGHINEEIHKRKRQHESNEELFIECPLPIPEGPIPESSDGEDTEKDRGFVILDFDI